MTLPRINKRLLVALVLVVLIPVGLQQSLIRIFTQRLRTEITENLATNVDNKAEKIDAYIDRQVDTADILAKLPATALAIKDFSQAFQAGNISSAHYQKLREAYLQNINRVHELQGFYDLFLIDPHGDIIFTFIQGVDFGTNLQNGPYRNSQLAVVARESQMELGNGFSNFEWYEPSKRYATFVSSPVMQDAHLVGVLVIQLAIDGIYQVVLNDIGLGQTGETILAQQVGDHAVLVAPLRSDPEIAFKREFKISDFQTLPLIYGLKGQQGQGDAVDYRHIPVLAAWRYLPRTSWALVVKMDATEAYAPVRQFQYLGTLLLIATLLFACTLTLWLGRAFTSSSRKV